MRGQKSAYRPVRLHNLAPRRPGTRAPPCSRVCHAAWVTERSENLVNPPAAGLLLVPAHRYQAVAGRRTFLDQLVWQMPLIAAAAGAFLFNIVWGGGAASTPTGVRISAALCVSAIGYLATRGVRRSRKGEELDSEWLAAADRVGLADFDKRNPDPADLSRVRSDAFGPNWATDRAAHRPNISIGGAAFWLIGTMWLMAALGLVSALTIFATGLTSPAEQPQRVYVAVPGPFSQFTSPAPSKS